MQITARVEVSRFPNDVLLQLVVVHLPGRLHEEHRRRTASPDDNTIRDEATACRSDIVFDGSVEEG